LEVIEKLTTALSKTRAEIDAIRTILVAATSTISAAPMLRDGFVARLQVAKDADLAVCLSSSMTDEMLKERAEWFHSLLPADVRPFIN
jgi:hypothetical protein